ncbi:MAG: dihydropteroate synthase [Bacteroidales bacterium]|nr:dihydropteroate synthase [Bacteroidales bacterium]
MIGKVQVMGIVNLTDDSFYEGSRMLSPGKGVDEVPLQRMLEGMVEDGADILDLGACSTRPGSDPVDADLEWERLEKALRTAAGAVPGVPVSIDTFRPGIVRRAFDLFGPFIVNDVSGGCERMWETVSELGLEYVCTHTRGTSRDMMEMTDYQDVTLEVTEFFERFGKTAEQFGIKDWILDPGFGFAKNVEQNWRILKDLGSFRKFGKRILAGLSRKSFLYKPLGITPSEALEATQVANFLALKGGADILRVHDVKKAVQTIRLHGLYHSGEQDQNPV